MKYFENDVLGWMNLFARVSLNHELERLTSSLLV